MEMIQKEKVKLTAKVVSQEALTDDICSMWIQADAIAKAAKPGQFISVYTKDKSKVLPRPISLCEVDKEQGRLRIVYRVVGAGTREFSAYQAGDDIEIMGPLGNGSRHKGVFRMQGRRHPGYYGAVGKWIPFKEEKGIPDRRRDRNPADAGAGKEFKL